MRGGRHEEVREGLQIRSARGSRDQALKFLLEPRHVAPAVLFLLGSASSAITGQEIVVDGGKFMG